MIAFVFPGQGSQKLGMGRAMHEACADARATFAQAGEALGYDLANLCFDGPENELVDTLHAQPALLVVDVLYAREAAKRGLTPAMTAGHSLGEYAALVCAEVLDLPGALTLVKRRAELMAAAPGGTMAAIIGLPDDKLPAVLENANSAGLVVAANYNSPGQIVVSGEQAGVTAAMEQAKAMGAKLAVSLPVSGAFHSPLMEPAAQEMGALIDAAPFRDAKIPVYQNSTARAATVANDLKQALKAQMTGPVRWSESIGNMGRDGATQFYELGPGKVLAGLIKRIDKSLLVEAGEGWDA